MSVGGTPGTISELVTINTVATEGGVFFDVTPGASYPIWAAGSYAMRLNISQGNGNVRWDELWICRVNAACAVQQTIASQIGMDIVLTGVGVVEASIAGVVVAAPLSTDKIYCVLGLSNLDEYSAQSIRFISDQLFDTPLELPPDVDYDVLRRRRSA